MRDVRKADSDKESGGSPILGIAILFGMVFAGAILVFFAGSVMIDGLQSDAEGEMALTAADETQHRFASILAGSGPQEIPMDNFRVTEDGTVQVGWGESSGSDWEWEDIDSDCRANVSPVGAIEQNLDDRTVVYQSGATWVQSDSTTYVDSSPSIGFDGDALNLQILQTSQDDLNQNDVAMLDDSSEAQQTATEVQDAAECTNPDLLLVVEETAYHEGWYDHLDSEFNFENTSVTHEPEKERVKVVAEGIKETGPNFNITSYDASEVVTNNDQFDIDVEIENEGHATGNDTLELAINPSTSTDIEDLEPQNSTNETLSIQSGDLRGALDIAGPPGNKYDLSRYGEYEYTLNTSDTEVTNSFFYSYPDEAYYNLTKISDETDGDLTTIAAEMTNIGEEPGDYDVTISLEGEDEDVDKEWTRAVEMDPWNDTTVEADFNRSALPNDEYTYTVEIDNPEINPQNNPQIPDYEHTYTRSEQFENTVGIDCETESCTVADDDEPVDVNVSVIGTEISYEGPNAEGDLVKEWGAVTASTVIGDSRYRFLPDGTTEEIPIDEPHYTESSASMEDYNLNTFGTQETVYSVNETIDKGSVSFEATYWTCDEYEEVGTDDYDGDTFTHSDCTDFGDPITVSVEDGDESNSDDGFVMTRDADRNKLPDIEEGYDQQRNVSEVFEDGTDGEIDIVERNGENELALGTLDFAFMTEVTMDREGLAYEYEPRQLCDLRIPFCGTHSGYDGQYDHVFSTQDQAIWNDAAWDIAQDYRDESLTNTGDPNFNDVIGLAQISGTVDSIEYDALADFRVDGEQRTPDETRSESETVTDESGIDIQVGSDHIVIG